ncbi:MAG: hypothetical protein QF441_12085 [Bacteriovoracaceae bacterium]|jgi:hypothetical protein|nr:hypothetical protein [Bacteriovoracaceae bacterium]
MKFIILILIFISQLSYANKTCSRFAVINYQKVLVDAGTNKKGEGLRFYLEKDSTSKELLDKYQEKNKPTIFSASASTAGSLLIMAGLLQTNNSEGVQNNNTLIYGGAILVALSYLTSKTMMYSNEKILNEAINQYNKRNSPKIYFSPFQDSKAKTGLGLGIQQEF